MKIKNAIKILIVVTPVIIATLTPANGYVFSFNKSADSPVVSMITGSAVEGTSSVMHLGEKIKFDFNLKTAQI